MACTIHAPLASDLSATSTCRTLSLCGVVAFTLPSRPTVSANASERTSLCFGQNESAPETGALPKIHPIKASGSDRGRLDLQKRAGALDRDRPRLHGLRNLAHEVDV